MTSSLSPLPVHFSTGLLSAHIFQKHGNSKLKKKHISIIFVLSCEAKCGGPTLLMARKGSRSYLAKSLFCQISSCSTRSSLAKCFLNCSKYPKCICFETIQHYRRFTMPCASVLLPKKYWRLKNWNWMLRRRNSTVGLALPILTSISTDESLEGYSGVKSDPHQVLNDGLGENLYGVPVPQPFDRVSR